ncbi:HEAT repeat domain-containing protein [Streptomyces sp. SGAir0957]
MDVAHIVLSYLQTLIWPALLVLLLILFRAPLRKILEKVATESGELSASVFGVEVRASLGRKMSEEMENLAQQADRADPDELRASVKGVARKLVREEFQALSSAFYGTPLGVRQQVAGDIAQMAPSLELPEILEFARSPETGERVGAAIALGVHLRSSAKARENPEARAALSRLLKDPRSRVRYRAVEALQYTPELVSRFTDELTALTATEKNADVRTKAQRLLRTR